MGALNNRWIVTSLTLLLAACESSPTAPPPADAALDRSLDVAADAPDDLGDELKSSPDVELDDDVSVPDDLPAPPTGCHLLSDAGPALPASDAGLPDPGAYPPLRGFLARCSTLFSVCCDDYCPRFNYARQGWNPSS